MNENWNDYTTPTRTSQDRDLPDRDLPGRDPERETPEQRPLEGTWDQAARHEVTSYRDPPVNRQTGVKTVLCPKLCLGAVTRKHSRMMRTA